MDLCEHLTNSFRAYDEIRLNFAFPYDKDAPSRVLQLSYLQLISLHIAFEFLLPEFLI